MNAEDAPEALPAPDLPQVLPAFTPVPREKARTNGWKPEVQRAFIEALAETGSVRAACARVNRADHGAYLLRRHPEAEEFRRAWDAALDIALRRIEDVAMDRALNGHEVPVYSYGKLIGSRTVHNDRLLMFILRNRAPERFGGGLSRGAGAKGNNAIDEMKLARLKRQWHREWAAEAAAKAQRTSDEVLEGVNHKLERIRHNWLAGMSERTRALHAAYEESQREDDAAREAQADHPLLPGVLWELATREDLEARRAEAEAEAGPEPEAEPEPATEAPRAPAQPAPDDEAPAAPPLNRVVIVPHHRPAPGQIPTDGRAKLLY